MECDVCYTEYNLQDHEPRVLPCGHTTCKHCVAQMRASHLNTACPHCRQGFDSAKVHPNFALINVLRERAAQEASKARPTLCSDHGQPHDVFCLTCCRALCRECYSLSGAPHATHDRASIAEALVVRNVLRVILKRSCWH